jgi:hypothetical protein
MDKLVLKHGLNGVDVGKTKIISANLIPVAMVAKRGEWRFQAAGGLFVELVSVVLLLLCRSNQIVVILIIFLISAVTPWLAIRSYYEIRRKGSEYLILVQPTAPDSSVVHELVHLHLGHLKQEICRWRLILASPLGPLASVVSSLGFNECEARVYVRKTLKVEEERHWMLPGGAVFVTLFLAVYAVLLIWLFWPF